LTILTETFDELHKIESPHVSLSKTFILRHHWIDNFFSSLREKFFNSSQSFRLQFSPDIVYFTNEEKTRHFACVVVDESCNNILASLIRKVDACLKEFNLEIYYDAPSYHTSLLWKLNPFSVEEKQQISLQVCNLMIQKSYQVEKISFKTGNKLMEISL
jgi:U6 snRNA phosphodiesterase